MSIYRNLALHTEYEENTHPHIYSFKNEMDWHMNETVAQKLKRMYDDPYKYRISEYESRSGLFVRPIVELWSTEKIDLEDIIFIIDLKKYFLSYTVKDVIAVEKPLISSFGRFE
jgi:hypothetical protein